MSKKNFSMGSPLYTTTHAVTVTKCFPEGNKVKLRATSNNSSTSEFSTGIRLPPSKEYSTVCINEDQPSNSAVLTEKFKFTLLEE